MKALASDFDGTIYFEDIPEHFKEGDLKAIQEFQKQGHLFGICTGRPLRGITDFVEGKIDFDFYILTSGALILDKNFHVIEKTCIDKELACQICQDYQDQTKISIQADDVLYALQRQPDSDAEIRISSIQAVESDDIYGLSFNAHTLENARKICQELNERYEGIDAFQNKQYIDLVKKGCSKGQAIKSLQKYISIDAMAGIGDNYNDLPMLNVVDQAFTFTYAPTSVQKEADVIVSSVQEAIEYLL